MKKSFVLFVLIAVGIFTKAADLIVEENGILPSYSSISSAITAAGNGDRIFIKNKAGNLPWLENITISKSLDLLAYVNDSFFVFQGNVTIAPISTATINIIGMINLGGISGPSLISSSTQPTGSRSIVRILGGQFANGSIVFPNSNYDLIVSGCSVNGFIEYAHGSICGNAITSSSQYGVYVVSESAATTDTSYIIGNKISSSYSTGYGIYWYSSTMAFDIRNNFVTSQLYGIYFAQTLGNSSQLNKVYNNTVSLSNTSGNSAYGIYVTGSAGSQIDVQNNVIDRNNATNYTYTGIYGVAGSSGGTLTVTYNYVDVSIGNPISGTITVNLNNSTAIAITLNGNGSIQAGVGVNAGNPGTQFYDTDLTVNDVGCYGGSFTLNNFFPQFTGAANTWLTNYQFNVRTGNTLNIKANSYDR